MLRFYDTASIFMEESYFKWTDRDPKAIQDAVGNFLEGVGNMMGSAVLSRSNKTSEESEVNTVLSNGFLLFFLIASVD